MYRHESSRTSDRPQSSHIAAKTAEKNVAVPISNQFALSCNITQLQSFGSDSDELHNKLTKRISSRRNNGLPAQLQNGIENLSGYSMDNVRVHYNSPRPAGLNALAYAKGEDIYVAPGQEKHLPHEAWHIVQQKQGRAVPTGRLNGVDINDNPALEHEADVMGAKAAQLLCAVDGNADVQLQRDIYPVIQLLPSSSSGEPDEESFKKTQTIMYTNIKNAINAAERVCEARTLTGGKAESAWRSIVKAFSKKENIDIIIKKMFSETPLNFETAYKSTNKTLDYINFMDPNNEVLNKGKISLKNRILNNICKSINITLNDIFYWNDHSKSNEKVTKIQVTDSDLHTRGVGVCIVTFSDGEKLVIKPEQKNFEKAVYGKSAGNDTSLAAKFNNIQKPSKSLKDENAQVGELGIETSDNHGTACEYFPHKQLNEIIIDGQPKINNDSLINTIIFSSLLGLADLHYENMVYNDKDGKAQLIDAEVGFKYLLDPKNPLASALKKGEMSMDSCGSVPEEFKGDFTKYHDITFLQELIKFLDYVKKNLKNEKDGEKQKNQRIRIVPIKTNELYQWRKRIYNQKDRNGTPSVSFFDYKNALLNSSILFQSFENDKDKNNLDNRLERPYKCMINDFRKGIIPFFELNPATGDIYQKFSDGECLIVSDTEKSLDNFVEKNINVLETTIKHVEKVNMIKKVVATIAAIGGAAALYKYSRK